MATIKPSARENTSLNSTPVSQNFDAIAPTYDILNHILSFGMDFFWRRRLTGLITRKDKLRILDMATGTGDLIVSLLRRNHNITETVGLDISKNMLALCNRKIARHRLTERVNLVCADATDSKLANESFDVITIGFGIRNTPDTSATLAEIYRLLKSGGMTLILEFSMPANKIIRKFYLLYLRYYVPLLGRIISKNRHAYRYLNTSIEKFHSMEDFCRLMQKTGFENIKVTKLTFGIASIYKGIKPDINNTKLTDTI